MTFVSATARLRRAAFVGRVRVDAAKAAAANGRSHARGNNNNRNNASLPRAGD